MLASNSAGRARLMGHIACVCVACLDLPCVLILRRSISDGDGTVACWLKLRDKTDFAESNYLLPAAVRKEDGTDVARCKIHHD